MKKELLLKFSFIIIGLIFLMMPISNVLGFGFDPDPDPDPDTTDPTVTITHPSSGGTISGGYTFRVNANDDVGVTEVHYYIDTVYLGYSTTAPFSLYYTIFNSDFYLPDDDYLLRAFAFDAAGNYAMDDITIEIVNGRDFLAVIVGINDYTDTDFVDLHDANHDADDWYTHLNSATINYDYIRVLGDDTSTYTHWDDSATEENIKAELSDMFDEADGNDVISFIVSGHGGGDTEGSAYYCALDSGCGENGEDGNITDTELAAILDDSNNVAGKFFIFLDCCQSGGFEDDFAAMTRSSRVYCAAGCQEDGVTEENYDEENGWWTYYFLDYTWQGTYSGAADVSMESVFSSTLYAYPDSFVNGARCPEEYDGDSSKAFYAA
ncbi:MAG: Ig-like domain-containing protein [Candidatus Heimdallarchaeota archaeon]